MIESFVAFSERIAFSDKSCRITYKSLHRSVQAVSRMLMHEKREIGICMKHGICYAIYMLGAIEAGLRVYLLHPNVKKNVLTYLKQRNVQIYTDNLTYANLKEIYEENLLCQQCVLETNLNKSEVITCSGDVKSVLILSTSGTTSVTPKFVSIPFHNMYLKSIMIATHLDIREEDVNLLISPLCFVQSIWALLIHLLKGAEIHFSLFRPKQFDQLLNENHITTLITTPSVVRGIIDHNESNYQLRLLSIGGDFMDDKLLRKLQSKWPDVKYANVYGATETCAADTIFDPRPFRDLDESFFTVGRPSDYSRIFIISDTGEILPPMVKGNICIQSPFLIDHYDNTNVPIRDFNGFFLTYDIGYLDMDEWLHYCGRSASIIVYNGEKIAASEVENLLYNIDGVKEVVVIGKTHELYGQIPVAFIVSERYIVPEEIQEYLTLRVEKYKIPKEIHFVNELKHTNSGKIVRNYTAYE